jgi:hypothetical protein
LFSRKKPDLSTGPKLLEIRSTGDEREKYENSDNDSNNGGGATVYGDRPNNAGATTADAGADKRHANYCTGEREENA